MSRYCVFRGMHMTRMVEITLILHEHQSKFQLPGKTYMVNVVSNPIYVQFLSNRDYLEGHNVSRY